MDGGRGDSWKCDGDTCLISRPKSHENVWSALKSVVKPKKKDDLVKGIHAFCKTLTAEKCAKYIDHVHRVIPHVILNYGGPTQFWWISLDEEPWLCIWPIYLTWVTLCQNQTWLCVLTCQTKPTIFVFLFMKYVTRMTVSLMTFAINT